MPKLKSNCQICEKPLNLLDQTRALGGYYRKYSCGHSFFEADRDFPTEVYQPREFNSLSKGYTTFPFQVEGVDFIERSNFNCLIADPMGLGKTIQALVASRANPQFKSILCIVKSATQYQWFHESKEWFSNHLWSSFLITSPKNFIPPGFRLYIISMDLLARFMKTPKGSKALKDLNIDLTIVDEAHSFKNPDSARSQALVAFIRDISFTQITRPIRLHCVMCQEQWTEETTITINLRGSTSRLNHRHETTCPKCKARTISLTERVILDQKEYSKGLILLSGTPIKNRADEYFIPLNLLRPDIFTSLKSFQHSWCMPDDKGKYTRLATWKLDSFRELTKNFILRREKNEVLSLPPFRRSFKFIFADEDNFKRAYNSAVDQLDKAVAESDAKGKELNYWDLETHLMRLRRIVGQAKVPHAVDYIGDFLDTVENEKLAIGIHHESVRDSLYFALREKGIPVLKLSGEDSAEKKNQILVDLERDPSIRVLIINTIAGGVGLNIQSVNNVLTLERQWNAADEEQFEARFWRQGQTLPVLNEYLIAQDIPIEDYFNSLVENKRKICLESLDGYDLRNDKQALRDLVDATIRTKL